MSKQFEAQREALMHVKLVDRADAKAAHASAEVLAKFGIALVVFTDRDMMNHWLAGVRKINGLNVRVLKDMEALHG